MKQNKVVFPLIIVLLLIFLPCSIYGIYYQSVMQKEKGNPEHLHKFENKLYYYDDNDKLKGIYECKTATCDTALTQIEDEYLKYYEGANNQLGIIADEYVLIQDGEVINLYNLKTERTITEFTLIKNYGTTLENNGLIVRNKDGNYGLFNINQITFVIEPQYHFMGLSNHMVSEEISTERIAVKESENWYIINRDNQKLSSPSIYPIYDYDKTYIYHIDQNNNYLIYLYDGNIVLPGVTIKKIDSFDNIHVLLNSSGQVLIYNYEFTEIISRYSEFGKYYDYKIEDNKVNIYDGNSMVDSYKVVGVE
ncbi:MAG: hypothetical protein E7164_03130 [Firmicutes bacterium]|nr:hypothetical protein [Bacillota bacterium]